jgi:lathosterol oxidase
MSKEEWTRQTKEMEKVVKEVEGSDDRTYSPHEDTKKSQ